jgi:hypothetical protein
MLAIKRPNINNILNEQQLSKLPYQLWERVEYMLEKTVLIVIQYMRRETKLIKLVDIDNNSILKDIVIDDSRDEYIKLSSDGNYLTYINYNNNTSISIDMIYYNINTSIKNVINISSSGIFPKYHYFDRNGLYYVVSNKNETMIFDIQNKKLMYTLPIFSKINIISDNYKKIMCRTNDYMKVYDFNNGNELYSIELNHLEMGGMSLCGNHIFYKNNNIIKIINDKLEYNYINEDIDLDFELKSIAFHPNNIWLALHFEINIIIIDMIKNNIIKNIENIMFDENERYNEDDSYYEMEFTKDGKSLIVRYTNYNIKKIDLL